MQRMIKLFAMLLVAAAIAAGTVGAGSLQAQEPQVLMMATTTSTDNTGLLDVLAPRFLADTGIELQWTAVGTGKALELGRNCDVDVLFVHAPAAEIAFVDGGYGTARTQVMYNDFVIVGPAGDPAGIAGMTDVAQALAAIAQSGSIFVSRGDDSGTNKKEIALWTDSGMTPPDAEAWYVQSGQGMMPTLNMAAERQGYTLTDRGTWIAYMDANGGEPPLAIVVEGDARLFNQYSVIPVNPANCPSARIDLAERFVEWIVSPEIQAFIADFRLLGQPLFTPNAD